MAGERKEGKESNHYPEDIWITDTEATCHMAYSDASLVDIIKEASTIEIGDGFELKSTKKGKLRGVTIQLDGTMTTLTLGIVKVVPSLAYNLFSINTVLDKDFDLGADKTSTKSSKPTSN